MSIQTQITRISTAKSAIATAITGKGVTVPSGTKIDGMAALIDTITTGGELESITITTPPTKTSYIAGEDFDPTGMEVTAVVSGVSIPVTGYTVTPSTLTAGVTSVTIGLTVNGVTKSATQAVTVIAYKSFSECTWAEIAQYAADGVAKKAFAVGDTRTETIGTKTYELVIYDFDHYDLVTADTSYNNSSGKAAIVIGLKNVYNTTMSYGEGNCEWENSYIYTYLNSHYTGQFFYDLPSDLQSVIREVSVPSRRMSSTKVANISCEVFIASVYEIFGKPTGYGHPNDATEGPQYAYYAAGNSISKNYLYVTRTSAYLSGGWDSYDIVCVTTNSNISYADKDNTARFSPVFCI